jgi:pyridoxine kinase
MVHRRSGNRSAVLPLEASGINVDPLHTCQFSTHTGYPVVRGTILTPEQFTTLIDGLRQNGILPLYTHLLTGYIANPLIAAEIAALRSALGSQVCYCCDPVFGDCGRLYVPAEGLEATKIALLPTADTITPNAYEAMWLTGKAMRNQAELRAIVSDLHKIGPTNVVISSTEWNHRISFFSWANGTVQLAIETPTIQRDFDGPGDMFAALLLANSIKFPGDYRTITERTVNSVFAILETTAKLGTRELEFPAAIGSIVSPPQRFKVMTIEEFDALEVIDNAIATKLS